MYNVLHISRLLKFFNSVACFKCVHYYKPIANPINVPWSPQSDQNCTYRCSCTCKMAEEFRYVLVCPLEQQKMTIQRVWFVCYERWTDTILYIQLLLNMQNGWGIRVGTSFPSWTAKDEHFNVSHLFVIKYVQNQYWLLYLTVHVFAEVCRISISARLWPMTWFLIITNN